MRATKSQLDVMVELLREANPDRADMELLHPSGLFLVALWRVLPLRLYYAVALGRRGAMVREARRWRSGWEVTAPNEMSLPEGVWTDERIVAFVRGEL